MMGIVFVDFICYFFNNLEMMADKKRNICQRVGSFNFFLKVKPVYMYESVSVN